MRNIGSRLSRIEEHMNKVLEQQEIEFNSAPWKYFKPEDIALLKEDVDSFMEHFRTRASQNGLEIIPEELPQEEKNRLLVINSIKIMVIFIRSVHFKSLGSKEENEFLEEAGKYKELIDVLVFAEDAWGENNTLCSKLISWDIRNLDKWNRDYWIDFHKSYVREGENILRAGDAR